MTKTILLTGATDGIGFETAKLLVKSGHNVLVHGRTKSKLETTATTLSKLAGGKDIETYQADLSVMAEVESLANEVSKNHKSLDALINNAGVFKVGNPITTDGFDLRFIVNVIAPYLLTKRLLPHLSANSRVVNLSSAAQSPVNLDALAGKIRLSDNEAYAQSKLALTMWTFHIAQKLGKSGPMFLAVNPASLLGSKMVKDAYGTNGKDLSIGADILSRTVLSEEFSDASGKYFDNDIGQFSRPHPEALDNQKNELVVKVVEDVLMKLTT